MPPQPCRHHPCRHCPCCIPKLPVDWNLASTLQWAAFRGDAATVSALLAAGWEADETPSGCLAPRRTALALAAETGHEKTVKVLLLGAGAAVTAAEAAKKWLGWKRGETPLEMARNDDVLTWILDEDWRRVERERAGDDLRL